LPLFAAGLRLCWFSFAIPSQIFLSAGFSAAHLRLFVRVLSLLLSQDMGSSPHRRMDNEYLRFCSFLFIYAPAAHHRAYAPFSRLAPFCAPSPPHAVRFAHAHRRFLYHITALCSPFSLFARWVRRIGFVRHTARGSFCVTMDHSVFLLCGHHRLSFCVACYAAQVICVFAAARRLYPRHHLLGSTSFVLSFVHAVSRFTCACAIICCVLPAQVSAVRCFCCRFHLSLRFALGLSSPVLLFFRFPRRVITAFSPFSFCIFPRFPHCFHSASAFLLLLRFVSLARSLLVLSAGLRVLQQTVHAAKHLLRHAAITRHLRYRFAFLVCFFMLLRCCWIS
jgi:hypothetical protein